MIAQIWIKPACVLPRVVVPVLIVGWIDRPRVSVVQPKRCRRSSYDKSPGNRALDQLACRVKVNMPGQRVVDLQQGLG